MRYEAITGLGNDQLTELVTRVHAARGGGFASPGHPYALGLFRSVVLVVFVMRKNLTQAFAGAIFGVSQSTVSRRWDLLRLLTGRSWPSSCPPGRGGGSRNRTGRRPHQPHLGLVGHPRSVLGQGGRAFAAARSSRIWGSPGIDERKGTM